MTTDQRLDRLAERHEALVQFHELRAHNVRELAAVAKKTAESDDALIRIVFDHKRRIGGLEGA